MDIIFKWILKPLIEPLIEFINTGMFLDTLNQIFFIENSIGLPIATVGFINTTIAYFASLLLTAKLLSKLLNIYILKVDGDATVNPLEYLKSYGKGVVVILTFTVAYRWLADIVKDLTQRLMHLIGNNDFPVEANGTTLMIFLLIYIVFVVIIYINFLMNGIRLMILRWSIPFACVGLIDNDNGVYAIYMKKIFQTSATILVQSLLVQISVVPMLAMKNGFEFLNIVLSIAILAYSLKITSDLNDIFLASGASGMGNKASALGRGVQSIVGFLKK